MQYHHPGGLIKHRVAVGHVNAFIVVAVSTLVARKFGEGVGFVVAALVAYKITDFFDLVGVHKGALEPDNVGVGRQQHIAHTH